MFYVYVLRSHKDAPLYIGLTNNLTRRLTQHNWGASAVDPNESAVRTPAQRAVFNP